MSAPKRNRADVVLLLEGTYPYISGGVSSWVHQMIRGFPDLTFAAIFIGSRAEDYGDIKYEIPDNVVELQTHYLYERAEKPPIEPLKGNAAVFERVARVHEYFRAPAAYAAESELLGELSDQLAVGLTEEQFLYSELAWEYVRTQFLRFSTDPSFIDYFWSVRNMHAPIWKLARIRDGLPEAGLFHSISTGYAGFLGVLAKRKYGRPFVLSEHGIYTKERRIDLFSANWINDNRSVFQREPAEMSYYRRMWIRFFQAIGRAAYDAADQITALFETNRQRQIADGADPSRTRLTPNGVDVARYAPLRDTRPAAVPKVACLIGRVVPIKDVKTFIRAMRVVAGRMPEAEGWIAGPTDEDPEYAAECRELAEALGVGDRVRFLGFQQLTALLDRVGVVVLSSISEGLPLVVLEGFSAGVPAVCTDVGSCRQLVEGLDEEDRALGAAGRIVGMADPPALARAVLELLGDADAWQAASQAGIARVERYYTEAQMFGQFREIYMRALARDDARPTRGEGD